MKFLKSSLVFLSVLFLFVGTIGIDIFSHLCQENEMVVSYSAIAEDDCCETEVVHMEDCCEETNHESDCCDDELYHVQIKLDFFNEFDISPIIIPELVIKANWVHEEAPMELAREEYRIHSPPPKSGRDLILNKQYWLI